MLFGDRVLIEGFVIYTKLYIYQDIYQVCDIYQALRSSVEKYVALLSFEQMSSALGMGHTNFHVALLNSL